MSVHFCGDPQIVEVILSNCYFRQPAQLCVKNCSASTGRFVAKDKPEKMVSPTDLSNPLLTNPIAVRLAARIQTKIRKSSRSSSNDQIVLRCRFHEDCRSRTVFCEAGDVTKPRLQFTNKIGKYIRIECTGPI